MLRNTTALVLGILAAAFLLVGATPAAHAESRKSAKSVSADTDSDSDSGSNSSSSSGAGAGAAPRRELTPEQLEILHHGEIGTGSLIGGGLLGTFVGLGLGHVVYGQYGNKGWIFTVGELSALGLVVAGTINSITGCLTSIQDCGNGLAMYEAGIFIYLGFHIWEIVDVWTLPGSYNERYRAIKEYSEGRRTDTGFMMMPFAAPEARREGGLNAGLALSYRF